MPVWISPKMVSILPMMQKAARLMEIQRKQDYHDHCQQELQKSAGIEAEIQDLLTRQLTSKDAVDRAQEFIESLEIDLEKEKRREEILTYRGVQGASGGNRYGTARHSILSRGLWAPRSACTRR